MTATFAAMIHVDRVSKHFGGKRNVTALDDVSLAVEKGEMVSIVGPSGSGKSTLLNLIGALDRPTAGEVRIDGRPLARLSDDELTRVRRDKIGFVFQFFNLLPTLTCLENVGLPLHLRGWARRDVEARARELLSLVQLDARMDHLPEELSGGQRQRVAIARALSVYPPLILADEPTGNLDTATGAEILSLFRDLHVRLGTTFVIVTHDMTVANSCGRIIALRDGRVIVLLRLMTWPYVRKHALRTILTTGGIVLGVAVFVGMNSANSSVLLAFTRTVDRIAGRTELQVSAGETGFPEAVLERVQSVASVRVAVPVIEAVVDTSVRGEGSLLVLGIDMTGDRSLREYDLESAEDAVIDDPLVFLAQPDSIILSSQFAARNGLEIGSRIELGTALGPRRLTIRGIMRASGLATAFGGNLAIMDIYAAQKMFGRGYTFDRIDLALQPGATIAGATRELQALLGPGFQIEPPSARGRHFEAMIASFAVMMGASSLFALFIGMFIIYNAFAIAVTERRSEIGILRAIGATRGQIRWLFLGESAVMGLAGSLVGTVAGILIARGIAASVSVLLNEAFGLARETADIVVTPTILASAVGVGVVTSLVAAWLPARAAARVEPVQALQKGKYQMLSAGENRTRAILAVAFAAAAGACLLAGRSRPMFYASYVLAVTGVLLLGTLLSLGLARTLRPILKWLRPVEGALAADSLIQAPRRTSATVAALMLSIALAVAFAGMARASYGSILAWVQTALNPDLFVMPSHQISIRTLRFPASMLQELEALPGVRGVQAVRNPRVMFRNTPVMLLAMDLLTVEELTPVRTVAGGGDMLRIAAAGQGVLVSDSLAQLHRLGLGEMLDLAAPGGVIHLPIAGIVIDYSDQQGAILIDRSVYQQYWQDDSVNFYRVYLTRQARADDVRRRILERYADERRVFVLKNEELRSYILRITDQWFALTYVQVAVAVIVAILGIANTLTVSITDRRRELGTLRAVGGLKAQIRRTIWMEALSTGALGIVLGSALGAVNLYYVLQMIRHDVAGMRLEYEFPIAMAIAIAPVILCAAFLAALWPAELAVRGSLVEALEYE